MVLSNFLFTKTIIALLNFSLLSNNYLCGIAIVKREMNQSTKLKKLSKEIKNENFCHHKVGNAITNEEE